MESFTIFGGNTLSTLAGEFSFSWSFALSIVYLGLVIRNVREGRRFSVSAGVVLALTALCHIITTMVVVVASLPLLCRRGRALS
jgi:predicted branched-subunit amino acid permease